MRHIILALSLIATSPSAGLAQDISWAGAYGGLTWSNNAGGHDYSNNEFYDLEGQTTGIFGGYLWNQGKLVYGLEAAITKGKVYELYAGGSSSYEDDYQFERFFDGKGRLGYTKGKLMVYGVAGLSRTTFYAGKMTPYEVDTPTNGFIYGVGADYKVASHMFVGLEYMRRKYDFYEPVQDVDIASKINTLTLRVGAEF